MFHLAKYWLCIQQPSKLVVNMNNGPRKVGGSNPIYEGKTELDSSSERAECRFFMKTGTCKYGDACKYSHPKERMLLSPTNLF
ncbi:hypothetical protein YC2023_039008 [Brassica napus]